MHEQSPTPTHTLKTRAHTHAQTCAKAHARRNWSGSRRASATWSHGHAARTARGRPASTLTSLSTCLAASRAAGRSRRCGGGGRRRRACAEGQADNTLTVKTAQRTVGWEEPWATGPGGARGCAGRQQAGACAHVQGLPVLYSSGTRGCAGGQARPTQTPARARHEPHAQNQLSSTPQAVHMCPFPARCALYACVRVCLNAPSRGPLTSRPGQAQHYCTQHRLRRILCCARPPTSAHALVRPASTAA